MELIKRCWKKEDGCEFVKFLESLSRTDKINWTKNIINTNMNVLAIKTPDIIKISKEIKKGNYYSFLDLNMNIYYENSVVNGKLISSIKDFNKMKHYLDIYSKQVDNWSSCDLLKFNIKGNEKLFFELAEEYIRNEHKFIRRIGILILFEFIDNDTYIDKIYEKLNGFQNEQEYYVNMANAWLLCELFIKRREKTIEFLKYNSLNTFTINKMISKCRDSFRVSKEDKEFLVSFRR